MDLLAELGAAKLHAAEQQTIRDAADALLFCSDVPSDRDATRALDALQAVMDRLVPTGRLMPETAEKLFGAVAACGPETEQPLLPVPLAA